MNKAVWQQAGAELKQIEYTKPFYIGFFVTFFDKNNPTLRKTNSSGNVLDTRQKILCAALVVVWVGGGGGVVEHLATMSYSNKVALELLWVELSSVELRWVLTFCS